MKGVIHIKLVLELAAREAVAAGFGEVTPAHLLMALCRVGESTPGVDASGEADLRKEFERLGVNPRRFRRHLRAQLGRGGAPNTPGSPHRSPQCKAIFARAQAAASEHGVDLSLVLLLHATLKSFGSDGSAALESEIACPACGARTSSWRIALEPHCLNCGKRIDALQPGKKSIDDAHKPEEPAQPPSLADLTQKLRALREKLEANVFGQDHAIAQFIDGLFNSEVVAAVDEERRKPCGLFVFAGPPGVGKTYLAELGASCLDRPFKRFDMSGYAQGHEAAGLTGQAPMYQGAGPGELTDFAAKHPDAILLFDEIEKAHPRAIQLFLQVLDGGRLQDKFTEETVNFRDTIVIFTTNAGRTLYDNVDASGIHQANASFHRNTVLDALRGEVDPRTREPFFPAALCSRLATGCPILFNQLRVQDLARVAEAELERVGLLLEKGHGQHYELASEIPLAIVMREGAATDARTVKARAEVFLKEEVFKVCQIFASKRVDAELQAIEKVSVGIDEELAGEVADRIFHDDARPAVLFIGDETMGELHAKLVPEAEWFLAPSAEQAFDLLTKRSVDFILLDLALPEQSEFEQADVIEAFRDLSVVVSPDNTILGAPHARRYATGQHLLKQLHARAPETPVYLFFLEEVPAGWSAAGELDEELLLSCVRGGGARGVIRSRLSTADTAGCEAHRDALRSQIQTIAGRLRVEQMASELGRQSQIVAFDTAPTLDEDEKHLQVRCRNFHLVRAVRSADATAVLSEVERPVTRFADVIGATGAKEALTFIRDWLLEPKKYAAAGVEPPRGVLLTGPPGTGKTMLARALAGESDCAFLVESATSFVTIWQGSGPQNVRDLFARARRYAPSIVFIDEIDAVGKARTGSAGAGRAQEETLNALLVEMDGFAASATRPVIVIAATNHASLLDPALGRRFSREIEAELPTRAERQGYLEARLGAKDRHEVSEKMIERIAAQSAGMSIASLENILNQAAVMAFPNEGIITDAILGEAFEKVTMGEAKPGADPLRTARHEAGHALLMCLCGAPPIYVTTVGRGNFGGYAAFDDPDERASKTKPQLEDRICQALGGREAERLFYGEGEGDSTGPASDLEYATLIAEAMVYEYGMDEEIGFVRIDRSRPFSGELAARCYEAVRKTIDRQSERTKQLLTEHRETLERIAAALVERERLLKDELLELLSPQERREAVHPE